MSSCKLLKLLKTVSVCLFVILVIALPINSFAKKTIKVGYYNLETLQKDLPEYQQLRDLIKQKQSELENLRGKLYREYQLFYQESAQKLETEKKGKSAEEQNRLELALNATLQQKINLINRQLDQKQQENARVQTEQTMAISENLKKWIAAVAAKKKLDLVVEKNNVFYGDNDITDLIVAQAKKEAEKAARVTTPKPTPAATPLPVK